MLFFVISSGYNFFSTRNSAILFFISFFWKLVFFSLPFYFTSVNIVSFNNKFCIRVFEIFCVLLSILSNTSWLLLLMIFNGSQKTHLSCSVKIHLVCTTVWGSSKFYKLLRVLLMDYPKKKPRKTNSCSCLGLKNKSTGFPFQKFPFTNSSRIFLFKFALKFSPTVII
ncbi:MAG: hypothetical protein CM15mV66_270 [uncultured marine virus]|nr:MAG: hypothetical protein CM15mV66_270 [uncultured marine virus]